jgi:hypothetical protein
MVNQKSWKYQLILVFFRFKLLILNYDTSRAVISILPIIYGLICYWERKSRYLFINTLYLIIIYIIEIVESESITDNINRYSRILY